MRPRPLLSATLAVLVIAAPPASAYGLWDAAARTRDPSAPQPRPDRPSFAKRIRDGAIHWIWGPPPVPASRASYAEHYLPDLASLEDLFAQYDNDVVLRFNLSTAGEADALSNVASSLFLDVWEHTHAWADIRLKRDTVPLLLDLLPASLQHAHTPLMHDLAHAVSETFPDRLRNELSEPPRAGHQGFGHQRHSPQEPTNIFFKDYQPLSVIHPWMRLMQSLYPTHVRMVNIGTSAEGREILGLRVGAHPTNAQKPSRPRDTVLVTSGSHAREWIGTAALTYTAYDLLTGYGRRKQATKLVDAIDWVFLPTLNPDGYVHTWDVDRLWRKTRQQTNMPFCKGFDLDRTFPFQWDGESTQGNPCSESYSGEEPLEAIESRRLVDWVANETATGSTRFVGFLDLHSYSQQVLYPFAYSCVRTPPTLETLEELGLGMAKAMRRVDGRAYDVTSACEGAVVHLHPDDVGHPPHPADLADQPRPDDLVPQSRSKAPEQSVAHDPLTDSTPHHDELRKRHPPMGQPSRMMSLGGSALDHMYHSVGVRHAFQLKLRDRGSYGFLLPRKDIVPTGREVAAAVEYMGRFLLGDKGIERGIDSEVSAEGMGEGKGGEGEGEGERREDEGGWEL